MSIIQQQQNANMRFSADIRKHADTETMHARNKQYFLKALFRNLTFPFDE